jgi:organic radical activating enzyme
MLVHNCDTTWALVNKPYCKIKKTRGRGFIKIRNPLSVVKLLAIIKKINKIKGPYHSVAITGGEPLLQKDFLKELLAAIRQIGIKIYLETNGILFKELSEIIDYIDFIAMDIKLPSSTGLRDFWYEHERFLRVALRKKVFIKAVICDSTRLEDLKKAVDLIANLNKNIPFVLQPNSFEMDQGLINKIRRFQRISLNNLLDVRVIPQMHKMLGIR